MALNNAPDLTQRPPRSPRVRLGGYVILPRMLDKGRATINGKLIARRSKNSSLKARVTVKSWNG